MRIWSLAALGAAIAGTLLWINRTLVLVTVQGSSMEPALLPGDRVLVRRRRLSRVRRGDVVVLEPPTGVERLPGAERLPGTRGLDGRLWNIKRAVALPGDPVPPGLSNVGDATLVPEGSLVVLGDNPHSADSKQRGFFSADDLLGVMIRRMPSR